MKKVLLSVAAFGLMTAGYAQALLDYGFEASQTAPSIVEENWNNADHGSVFPNSSWTAEGTDAMSGEKALTANVEDDDCASYQRVVAFLNLGIEENSPYRVSLWAKGTGTPKLNIALLKGEFDHDTAIDGTRDQALSEEYTKYVYTFMCPSRDKLTEAKADMADDQYWNKDFLRLSFMGKGTYALDDIKVEKTVVKSVLFNANCIEVQFIGSTNIAEKAGETIFALENDAATVTDAEGEPVSIAAIELHQNGNLYIYTEDDLSDEVTYTISFTAPEGVSHSVETISLSFSGETAEYSDEVSEPSFATAEPLLVSSTPADNSFNQALDLKEFSFTFDHAIDLTDEDYMPAATLEGPGINEQLLLTTTESSETIAFKRTIEGKLAKGPYTVTIANLCTTGGGVSNDDLVVSFEVGKVQVAKTIFTAIDGASLLVPASYVDEEGATQSYANGVPQGWTVVTNNEVREFGQSYGSGGRTFIKDYGPVIYFRAGNGEEGSVTTPAVTLPAGATQLRAYIAAWKNEGHDCNVQILDAEDNVVAEKKITGTANAENGNASFEFAELRLDFEAAAGDYHLKFNDATLNGNGLAIKGGEFFTVAKTEGESVETEVLAELPGLTSDVMPAHGTGWKIYRANGNMRDPGSIGGWTGTNDWTGGGGSRPQPSGLGGPIGATAIYLAGNNYATYGEYEVFTDHNGPVIAEGEEEPAAEKTLDLNAAKYQITYYIGGWKSPGETHNVKLEIFNFEDGITGTPIYTRTDDDKADDMGNHNKAAANPTGKKISFFWTAPAEGKYILKFTAGGEGEGEALFGGFKLETTVSLAIQYAQMLDVALEPLIAEQTEAHANDNYAGATRDEIDAKVAEYSNPDYHTVAEYEEAINNCSKLIKKMQARRANIDAYPTSLEGVKAGLEAAQGTKFEALEQYPTVEAAYNKYKDAEYVAMTDDELAEAVATMGDNGTLLKNMVETCCPILTEQMIKIVEAILALDEEAAENGFVVATDNAISDDQDLVANLKLLYAAKLYKKFATEADPFHTIDDSDPENPTTIDVEYPVDFLIQNAGFYTMGAPVIEGAIPDARNNYPGWTITVESGKVEPVWATTWGESYPTNVKPVDRNAVKSPWGPSKYSLEQTITNLPVGAYNVSMAIGHDDAGGECYVYVGETHADYAPESCSRDQKVTCQVENVAVAAVAETYVGSLTVGAYMDTPSFSQVDDAKLQIVAKDADFDYAAAATALGEVISGIEVVAREDAPVAARYYNLNGQEINAAEGVCIKIETYADGYTVVKKVVKK